MTGRTPAGGGPFDEAVEALRGARRVCVLTGAGISAESGVPTFRGRDGIWKRYDPAKLATPEGFRDDPRAVWEWYRLRQRIIARSQPNAAHVSIAALADVFERLDVVTQNVDGLHQRAGSRDVLELHGSIWRMRCTVDGAVSTADSPVDAIPPRCRCGALLRPDVVWFGEPLPPATLETASEAASRADVMLVVGTSSIVYPAAALPFLTLDGGGTVVEVNAEATPLSSVAHASVFGRAGDIIPRIQARI